MGGRSLFPYKTHFFFYFFPPETLFSLIFFPRRWLWTCWIEAIKYAILPSSHSPIIFPWLSSQEDPLWTWRSLSMKGRMQTPTSPPGNSDAPESPGSVQKQTEVLRSGSSRGQPLRSQRRRELENSKRHSIHRKRNEMESLRESELQRPKALTTRDQESRKSNQHNSLELLSCFPITSLLLHRDNFFPL